MRNVQEQTAIGAAIEERAVQDRSLPQSAEDLRYALFPIGSRLADQTFCYHRRLLERSMTTGCLWLLRKGPAQICAKLRDVEPFRAELRLVRDAGDRRHVVVCYGDPHTARRLALEDAERCRREYEAEGWRGA